MTMQQGSCQEAAELSRLIALTGQIDDLVDVEGAEQDLADLAGQITLPRGIPRFAETVDLFRQELSKLPPPAGPGPKRSSAQMQQLAELSEHIREQASQFLNAATAQCLIAALRDGKSPPRPLGSSHRPAAM